MTGWAGPELLRNVLARLEAGERVALATVVRTKGSTPRKAGAKLAVYEDGSCEGTVCGGCVEAEVYQAARRLLLEGGKSQVLSFTLNEGEAEAMGLRCGGRMEVYVERLEPARRLYLFGAGHIARETARILRGCEVEVHVIDDHPGFANEDRFPGCEIHLGSFAEGAQAVRGGPTTAALVMTRSHRHDAEALREIAKRDVGYWGVVSSKKRAAEFLRALAGEGVPPERLARLRAPIGLDIGSETPAEIAVAVAAELLAFWKGGTLRPLSDLFRESPAGRKVLEETRRRA